MSDYSRGKYILLTRILTGSARDYEDKFDKEFQIENKFQEKIMQVDNF